MRSLFQYKADRASSPFCCRKSPFCTTWEGIGEIVVEEDDTVVKVSIEEAELVIESVLLATELCEAGKEELAVKMLVEMGCTPADSVAEVKNMLARDRNDSLSGRAIESPVEDAF